MIGIENVHEFYTHHYLAAIIQNDIKPVIQKWLDRAGPHGKEVLSIAAEYASGAKVMMGK